MDVESISISTNTMTVNGHSTYSRGEYFGRELAVDNAAALVWHSVSVAAPGETTVSGNIFVARTPESFGHDADENMTNDGR